MLRRAIRIMKQGDRVGFMIHGTCVLVSVSDGVIAEVFPLLCVIGPPAAWILLIGTFGKLAEDAQF